MAILFILKTDCIGSILKLCYKILIWSLADGVPGVPRVPGVPVQDIIDDLNTNNTLNGKNVIIVFQMCRGKKMLSLSNDDDLNIPEGFFVIFTSQPGFQSYTSKGGSIFMDEFTRYVETKGTIWHLERIIEETAKSVSRKGYGNYRQEPGRYENCSDDIWLSDEGKLISHFCH